MSQRVAGPVRTQRLGVRRRLRAQVLHVLPLHALVPRVQLRRLDQAHRGIALGLLSSVPDNVDQQVHRHRVALVRISAHAGQKKILGSPLVNLNLPSAN